MRDDAARVVINDKCVINNKSVIALCGKQVTVGGRLQWEDAAEQTSQKTCQWRSSNGFRGKSIRQDLPNPSIGGACCVLGYPLFEGAGGVGSAICAV